MKKKTFIFIIFIAICTNAFCFDQTADEEKKDELVSPSLTCADFRYSEIDGEKNNPEQVLTQQLEVGNSIIFGVYDTAKNEDNEAAELTTTEDCYTEETQAIEQKRNGMPTDEIITSLRVCRIPISVGVDRLINIMSFGKWDKVKKDFNYDQMFHLYLELNNNVRLERKQAIKMYRKATSSHAETWTIDLGEKLITYSQLLENAEKYAGKSFYRFDPKVNNCQVFVVQVLMANGLLTEDIQSRFIQDTEEVVNKLPRVTQTLMKGMTDFAYKVDMVWHRKWQNNVSSVILEVGQ